MTAEEQGIPVSKIVHVEHKALGATPIGGHIQAEDLSFAIAANQEATNSVSWSFDVDIVAGALFGVAQSDGAAALCSGDELSVWGDIGVVGTLTADAAQDQPDIEVDATVMAYVDVGDYVVIQGETTEYRVKAKDTGTNTLTLETNLGAARTTGNTVDMHRYFLGRPGKPLKMGPGDKVYPFGDETLDATRLPAGAVLKVKYKDVHNTAKTAYGKLSILY
jgi:hypothetical protein